MCIFSVKGQFHSSSLCCNVTSSSSPARGCTHELFPSCFTSGLWRFERKNKKRIGQNSLYYGSLWLHVNKQVSGLVFFFFLTASNNDFNEWKEHTWRRWCGDNYLNYKMIETAHPTWYWWLCTLMTCTVVSGSWSKPPRPSHTQRHHVLHHIN